MKKIIISLLIFATIVPTASAIRRRTSVPKVRYIKPKDDVVIDLTEAEEIEFSWKSAPKPGSGRKAYKFNIYKGFGYEVIVSEELDHKTYSIKIPADLFEDGILYSWQVKQRDARTSVWSMDHRWSFKVKK